VTMPLLSIEGLCAGYGAVNVIDSVDLMVRPGELVAVIGSNGAGKSSLLRTISGLLRVRQGKVGFLDHSLVGLAPERISRLGLLHVPEGRRVFADQTTEDNLWLGAYPRLRRKYKQTIAREIDGLFERFPQLGERRNSRAGLLSGGEQQMLAIARALIAKPRLLMLDEPSHGLAPIVVNAVFELLNELRNQGMTILLVEQLAYGALSVADRGYVLSRGKIVKSGSGTSLLEDSEIQRVYLGQTAEAVT
jgi:branched-chain amino acid transport system ATP-binding protein